MTAMRQRLWLCGAMVALAAGRLSAAEIQLRTDAHPRGAVVLLGDVAQIFANDRDQSATLEQVELFPAPAVGTKRFLRMREVQDALELRGISLAGHVFSGASQITVQAEAVSPMPAARPERGPTSSDKRRALQLVRDAVVRHLATQVSETDQWTVEVQFDDAQISRLASGTPLVAISGGSSPWTGRQQFLAQFTGDEGAREFVVHADVTAPPMVVVAVRALARGATIQAADVQLEPSGPQLGKVEPLGRLDDAIGKETTQALAAGRPVDRNAVRLPLLVRKGDPVTVFVRSPGVQLKTTARARDNGSQGELIEVESLLDRKTYFARVRGIQEVEVYARAQSAVEE